MCRLIARVDDRLLHGQVVVGCCGPLDIGRVLLASDDIAGDSIQRQIYRLAAPPELELEIMSLDEAARWIADRGVDRLRTLLITATVEEMSSLIDRGVDLQAVVLGGMHHREDRRELRQGFYFSETDKNFTYKLLRSGVQVVLQSVPGADRWEITRDWDGWGEVE